MLAKFARASHNMRAGAAVEPSQTAGGPGIDKAGQCRELRQVAE